MSVSPHAQADIRICAVLFHRNRTLLAEEKDIQSGAWDEKLTQGYELVTASAEPTQALYKHKFGAGTVEDAQKEAEEGATLKSAVPQSASTTATNSVQPEPPLPKEEAASPAKELQFAEQPISAPETSMDVDAAPMSRPEREGTAGSALQDVPEEDEGNEVEVEGTDAHTQKEEEEEEENEEARAGKADHEGEASAASTTSRQTRRSAQPVSAKASSSTGIGRGSLPERRSSNRVSRTSIANLSEIVPSTSSDAAEVTITSPPAAALPEEGTSPSRERDVVAPSSEGMDVDASSAGMERDDSKDSTAGQVASTTASTTTAKRGRPPRKSSVPPISTKDANKRKRTTTPQAQNKATSPAPSERSRSKRVKTEEPESGLGTPGEFDHNCPISLNRL